MTSYPSTSSSLSSLRSLLSSSSASLRRLLFVLRLGPKVVSFPAPATVANPPELSSSMSLSGPETMDRGGA